MKNSPSPESFVFLFKRKISKRKFVTRIFLLSFITNVFLLIRVNIFRVCDPLRIVEEEKTNAFCAVRFTYIFVYTEKTEKKKGRESRRRIVSKCVKSHCSFVRFQWQLNRFVFVIYGDSTDDFRRSQNGNIIGSRSDPVLNLNEGKTHKNFLFSRDFPLKLFYSAMKSDLLIFFPRLFDNFSTT